MLKILQVSVWGFSSSLTRTQDRSLLTCSERLGMQCPCRREQDASGTFYRPDWRTDEVPTDCSVPSLSFPSCDGSAQVVIQWRDQFGNYRNYQTSTAGPLPTELLKPRNDRRARSIESLMVTGTWWISSIPDSRRYSVISLGVQVNGFALHPLRSDGCDVQINSFAVQFA